VVVVSISYPQLRGESRFLGISGVLIDVFGEAWESHSLRLKDGFWDSAAGRLKVVRDSDRGRNIKMCRGRKAASVCPPGGGSHMGVFVDGYYDHHRGAGRKTAHNRLCRAVYLIVVDRPACGLSYSSGIAGKGDEGRIRPGDLSLAGSGSGSSMRSGLEAGAW